EGGHQARGDVGHFDALHHEGARQRALGQRHRQLHQPHQRARGADPDDQGGRPPRRYAQAVPRVPAGHAAQGVSRPAGERDHPRVRVSYQEQAESLFQNYLHHAEAYVNKTRVRDRNTNEELAPDEGFLKSIEEQIAIIGSAADGFRQEVIAYLWATSRRGEKISYKSYEPLKEAIEKKLMTSVRDISRIITKARTRDEEQGEKYSSMVKNLLENGYCESCVDVVLKYAANNLWKD